MTSTIDTLADDTANARGTSRLAWIAVIPAVSFGFGAWSMTAPVVVLFVGITLLATRWCHDFTRRLHGSLLLGTALAWALLPHTVFDFRDHGLSPIATDIKGCTIMVQAGFPIQLVSGHGGGGWRNGYHLLSDQLVHAANCALLSLTIWFLWRPIPRHLWRRAHLAAWVAFLPMCFYGYARMFGYWD